jgi:hypothetical protein
MTCIIGIAANGKVWMGADTFASDRYSGTNINTPKVFTKQVYIIPGGFPETEEDEGKIDYESCETDSMAFGCCGGFRMMQILEHWFEPPAYYPDQETVIKYLTTGFMDGLREVLTEKGAMKRGKDVETTTGDFLLGFRGELYHVDDTFQLIRVPNQEYATGAGADFAFGSLFSTKKSKWPPQTRILEALECAATYNLATRGPFDIISIE